MLTKIAIMVQPGRFEIEEKDVTYNENEILVRVVACGLCNWELNHWKGIIGPHPLCVGHEVAGTVASIGENITKFKVGDKVTAMPVGGKGGFAQYAVTTEEDCAKIDDEINLHYALGEPLKCVVTVLSATAPVIGDYGVIVGCGPMGIACIQALAGKYIAKLIAIDVDDGKLKLATKYGATHVINSKTQDAIEALKVITNGRMADFVIEGTGIPAVLNTAVKYLKNTGRGKLVLMSSHESICTEFDFREGINRSINLIIPHPKYSMDQTADFRRAAEYISNKTFDMSDLISHKFSLENIQQAFETLENKPSNYIKGIVTCD